MEYYVNTPAEYINAVRNDNDWGLEKLEIQPVVHHLENALHDSARFWSLTLGDSATRDHARQHRQRELGSYLRQHCVREQMHHTVSGRHRRGVPVGAFRILRHDDES